MASYTHRAIEDNRERRRSVYAFRNRRRVAKGGDRWGVPPVPPAWPSFAPRPGCASRAGCPYFALRTRLPGPPLRAGRAVFALRPLRTDCASFSPRACRANFSALALNPLFAPSPLRSDMSSLALRALLSGFALRSIRAGLAFETLRPGGAGRPLAGAKREQTKYERQVSNDAKPVHARTLLRPQEMKVLATALQTQARTDRRA